MDCTAKKVTIKRRRFKLTRADKIHVCWSFVNMSPRLYIGKAVLENVQMRAMAFGNGANQGRIKREEPETVVSSFMTCVR